MKCPACSTEMKYFSEYHPRNEGYRCPACTYARPIAEVELDNAFFKAAEEITAYNLRHPKRNVVYLQKRYWLKRLLTSLKVRGLR